MTRSRKLYVRVEEELIWGVTPFGLGESALDGLLGNWLADWLTDWLVGWLADWLSGWMAGLLASWLADWLTVELLVLELEVVGEGLI